MGTLLWGFAKSSPTEFGKLQLLNKEFELKKKQ